MPRRHTNPRFTFVGSTELKLRAREHRRTEYRKRWSTPAAAEAKTERYVKRELVMANPKRKHGSSQARSKAKARTSYRRMRHHLEHGGSKREVGRWSTASTYWRKRAQRGNPGVFATVSEAVRAFKHQYGGQAYGWAQDAVSAARSPEHARFWQQVVQVLRRDVYRTNPGRRRNPKRDGTPTRGERRGDKYKDHLRKLRERGQKAADELNKLLGRGAAASVGTEHAEPAFKAPKTETQEAHPGHYAAELTAEQKTMREQLASVNALMGDIRDQLRDIGDDEALADGLSEQLVKLAKQRKALMDLAQPAAQTNPRRNPRRRAGRFRLRKFHPARIAAYRRALRELRHTVRSL